MPTNKFSHYETRLVYSTLIILIVSIAAVCWAVTAKHEPLIFIYTLPLLLFAAIQLVHIYFQHYALGSELRKTNNGIHIYPEEIRKKWYTIFTSATWLLIAVTIFIFIIYFKQLDDLLIFLYIVDILSCLFVWLNGRRFYKSDSSPSISQ